MKMEKIPRWISASPQVSEKQAPVQDKRKKSYVLSSQPPLHLLPFFLFLIKLDKGFFNKQEILELWHSLYN